MTGGKHLDAFIELICEVVQENCPRVQCYTQCYANDDSTQLPGFFRPNKLWDVVFIDEGRLLGCVELKFHVGPSFGNNYNNRTEEAIGTASDIQTAYREGAFVPSAKPWIGYLLILEETEKSMSPVKVRERHFNVFEEFHDASYATRYEVGMTRLVREGLFTSASLILSRSEAGRASWREPNVELSFKRFMASLVGHAIAATSAD